MSIELWFALALCIVLLLALAISLWMVAGKAAEQSDDLARWTERELKALSARVEQIEDMRRQPSRPAPSGPREGGRADLRFSDAMAREASAHEAVAPSGPPPPSLEEICEAAAAALASASTFVAFAEKYRGQGFTLEPGGSPPSHASGSADRADIHILRAEGFRLALPGFNLRRGQGLLTSDAGRAAEARLGWLFDIEPGPELRAIEGAFVELNDWTVRRKGRLSIPL